MGTLIKHFTSILPILFTEQFFIFSVKRLNGAVLAEEGTAVEGRSVIVLPTLPWSVAGVAVRWVRRGRSHAGVVLGRGPVGSAARWQLLAETVMALCLSPKSYSLSCPLAPLSAHIPSPPSPLECVCLCVSVCYDPTQILV